MKFPRSLLLPALLVCLSSTSLNATPNPVKGEQLFKQCIVCHQTGDGAENGVGPALNHVFGRQAGTGEGFAYSDAMKAKGEEGPLVWDEKSLYIFIAAPARYIPGTSMGFEGLRTEQEIKDLLSYLIQYSPAYEPGSGKLVPAELASQAVLPPQKSANEEELVPEFTAEFMTSAEAIADGGENWSKQCRHCHGNSAYPGKAPKLNPSAYKPEFVFDRITNGFRKMPGWKSVFTYEERKNLVAYVMSDNFAP